MSLKYEPASEPLHISVKDLGRAVLAEEDEHEGDVREDLEERVEHEDRDRRLRTHMSFLLNRCERDTIFTQPPANEKSFNSTTTNENILLLR